MPRIDDLTVPSEELDRLTHRSYEKIIPALHEALNEQCEKIFGEDVVVQLLATYATYANVLSEDGRFARIKYKVRAAKGGFKIEIESAEKLEVRTFDSITAQDYLDESAEAAVSALLEGNPTAAGEHIRKVSRLVTPEHAMHESEKVEAFLRYLDSPRSWRTFLLDHLDDVLQDIEEDELVDREPRFEKIYNPPISGDGEAFRAVVMKSLGEEITALEETQSYLNTSVKETTDASVAEGKASELSSLIEFLSTDLDLDLKKMLGSLRTISRCVRSVPLLAHVHDVTDREVRRIGVIKKFIGHIAQQLQPAK